jgi:hypothetical protein
VLQRYHTLAQLLHMLLLAATLVLASMREGISSARNAVADQLQAWANAIAARGSTAAPGAGRRQLSTSPPGFCRQFYLCLTRAVLMRSREPAIVAIEYSIFAGTGVGWQRRV